MGGLQTGGEGTAVVGPAGLGENFVVLRAEHFEQVEGRDVGQLNRLGRRAGEGGKDDQGGDGGGGEPAENRCEPTAALIRGFDLPHDLAGKEGRGGRPPGLAEEGPEILVVHENFNPGSVRELREFLLVRCAD